MAEQPIEVTLTAAAPRLDRALADALPDMSRARVQALMLQGAITREGAAMTDPSAKAHPGVYRLIAPDVLPADPQAEDIALTVLFEDAHLIVIDKPAGMSAHPAPGSRSGTLVNALIHHCGASLSGIGGVARPGIVHRLDKDTSGVMVAAKTDAAHRGPFEPVRGPRHRAGLHRPHPRRAHAPAGHGQDADRPLTFRPQEDGGAARRRPRGDHPL